MRTRFPASPLSTAALLATLFGCDASPGDPPADMGNDMDAQATACSYGVAPVPPAAARIGQPIAAGTILAGVGTAEIDLPVGTPLSGYTARMRLLGGDAPDNRQVPHARAFVPSAGMQSRPQVRALYLKAGEEPVILVKSDLCLAFDRLVYDMEAALADVITSPGGARGRVILSTSHSHAAPGTYHGAFHLTLGLDLFDETQYQRLLASLVAAARSAVTAAAPARMGAGIWDGWDPRDEIYSDRRDEDDDLPGPDGKPVGKHKDSRLLVLRVDDKDGKPLAIVNSFPIHGTVSDSDNPLTSVDAPGHIELALEDHFDRPVLVMHLQGPAGDASPRGRGGLGHCDSKKSLCTDFARMEAIGELAVPRILSLWERIATTDSAALEVVTRAVQNGRNVIRVRGDMKYAPYVADQEIDSSPSAIYTPDGKVRSPITQFNVEAGAGLCGGKNAMLPVDPIAGAKGIPYGSCADIGGASKFIANVLRVPLPPEGAPSCETTRATLSALRLGNIPVLRRTGDPTMPPLDESKAESLLLVTMPGEPLSLLADALRARSPAGPERTFVLGYAQGHVGYLLGVENWLRGGYEPSINLFGPLEGEWLMERALELTQLAYTPERDDPEAFRPGSLGGPAAGTRYDRLIYKPGPKIDAPRSPSGQAGTVPATLPMGMYVRSRVTPLTSAQPPAGLPRVSGRASLVFYGGDPEDDRPQITLERETSPGTFEVVRHKNGRAVGSRGRDILLTYTPDPVDATPGRARAHVWVAEWQAVGWDRSSGLEGALAAPLGRYRLTAQGRAAAGPYTVSSQPFEVRRDDVIKATATRTAADISGRAVYPLADSFRLLRLDGSSDGDVPIFGEATATAESRATGATRRATLDPRDGSFKIDTTGLDTSKGFTLTVEDKAGNRSTPLAIP